MRGCRGAAIDIDQLRDMANAGRTGREIADTLEVSINAVYKACSHNGIRIRRYGRKPVLKNPGNPFYDARIACGLSIKQAAEQIEVTPTTIWDWENGKTTPSFKLALEAARVYGTEFWERYIDMLRAKFAKMGEDGRLNTRLGEKEGG